MRSIEIILSNDSIERKTVSAKTTLKNINDLFEKTGVNGLNQILFELNRQLNEISNEDVKVILNNDLLNPPEGIKW